MAWWVDLAVGVGVPIAGYVARRLQTIDQRLEHVEQHTEQLADLETDLETVRQTVDMHDRTLYGDETTGYGGLIQYSGDDHD